MKPKDIVISGRPMEIGPTESFSLPFPAPKFKRPQPLGALDMLVSQAEPDLWIATLTPIPYRFALGLVGIELVADEDVLGEGPTRDAATQDLAKKAASHVMSAWLRLKTLGMDRQADSMVEADEATD